MSLYICVISF